MMRILHVVLEPRHSGAEILVAKLAIQHRKQNIPVAVSALEPADPSFLSVTEDQARAGITWFVPQTSGGRLKRFLALRKAISEFGPTVIFAHSAIPSIYARILSRLPIYSVLHAEDDYQSPALLKAEKFLGKRAKKIVCVSESARQNYIRRMGFDNTLVISNGVELDSFRSDHRTAASLATELGISSKARIILQVGRITKLKNQLASIRAFADIATHAPELHLVFAGLVEERGYQCELEQVAKEGNISDRVHFLGPRSDVPQLMFAAALILMPSEREAHSIAFLEALASQRNIVASDIPSFRFAKNEPGVSLISNPNVSERYAQEMQRLLSAEIPPNARNLSAFDIKTTARRYEELAQIAT